MQNHRTILEAIEKINVWRRGDQRAPHKPLLLLLAIGSWNRERLNDFPYQSIAPRLSELLDDFGPARLTHKTNYPFWRLQNDGLWSVSSSSNIFPNSGDVPHGKLLKSKAKGRLSAEFINALEENPELVHRVAQRILEAHFPPTLHDDILQAVGLGDFNYVATVPDGRTRDPGFRYDVLMAYEERCAICGFDVRLSGTLIGIEAAHIKWFQAGGPDTPENGLALCSLHHKLLDRGAFTIATNGTMVVSQRISGSSGLSEWLMDFHGKQLRQPVSSSYKPNSSFLDWHCREVFKGPARDLQA